MSEEQQNKTEQAAPAVKKARIYTMPDKFYIDDKSGGESKSGLTVLLLSIVAVLLIGGAVYFFVLRANEPEQPANQNTATATTNSSANFNVSTLDNANLNGNSNTNTLVLLNTNQTSNINTAVPSNLNLFTNTNTTANINAVPSSQDSDADGLTNVEEALYGSSLSVADTDGDSFADGQEVLNGYNPNGAGTLQASSAINVFTNAPDGYSVLYPSSWVVSDDPQNTRGKIFSTTGEFISISIQDNPARLSARDWYLTKAPGVDTAAVQTISNWDKTLSGVLSIDKTTAYFTKDASVYVVSYNTNILAEANYKTTYNMMYLSISLLTATTNTNSVINVNTSTNTNTNNNTNTNTANINTTNGNTNSGL